ncbi:mannose-6-phosphate isomerase ManA [Paenibacillus larvae subsp. larvae]|uniref:Mannose-6-phosphate isomerase n=2 Tax=Paenibacillus larvae TaxID=1464 RepID=A0A2L1U9K0_9BACL|nr:type I phosphomannose isomerase catalytic subunit [Paenibacillus larvae]AQT85488.1 mannose-6-phosphate isomerase [Paenibacillus larvae subsp. pulvifaciens]AQZ47498.1 mannose-6-phosphate isomerase [Paenibacillus larvae subsp. pulvifaciens]ARF68800.1 mannose-6-phosphate isomerase [Paenibacillus larvae subsp. pulvifaciens]AVF24854.1 mannose-6-phosphate isomerase ManA [Paenibacillus larvae subsp. larvae]AVF29614.1 mannose-6-phosphate isomerase ManA [Paenibacillus larvae subsp. larvae]
MKPYPLKFKPDFKERVWGGRALEQFGLELPEGHIGEGWMIADHPNGTSTVINGEFAGKGLDEVRESYGEILFGTKGFSQKTGRFPLLVKLLDCNDDLSVQVHPSDDYEKLAKGELGKTEMWYVLDAKPGAKIIYGLKEGVDREQLKKAIEEDRILDSLQEVSVQAGDSFYIPAGTVHALGAGVLVAEIQQNSDTTYRLYDYNRPGLDGKPRELHIEDSLNVAAYEGAGATQMKTDLKQDQEWLTIAESPYFLVQKGRVNGKWELSTNAESFVLFVIAEGSGYISWADGSIDAKRGDCFLLPATLGKYSLDGHMTVLRSFVP